MFGRGSKSKEEDNVEHVTKSRRWQKRKAFHICSICFTSSFEICLHIHITCIYVHYVSPYLCFHCYSERGDFPLICSGARTQVATFEVATHWSFTSCSPEDWGLSVVFIYRFFGWVKCYSFIMVIEAILIWSLWSLIAWNKSAKNMIHQEVKISRSEQLCTDWKLEAAKRTVAVS